MSDLQWTVVKLQQMLAERNATECDASKRDAEHALCRIANESLVHDLTRVMDERDRMQAEVQRLQAEVRETQRAHDCAIVAAYESGLRAGREAMRERCMEVCSELILRARVCAGDDEGLRDLRCLESHMLRAIRALEVE